MTAPHNDTELDGILESWLDEAFGTSMFSISPVDGYKGELDEGKIEQARTADYDAALAKAKTALTQYIHKQVAEARREQERVINHSPNPYRLDEDMPKKTQIRMENKRAGFERARRVFLVALRKGEL
jgi:hypothetical protein